MDFVLTAKMQMRKVMKYKNGLEIILKKDDSFSTVSINVFVKCGAVYENERQSGLSHFIEHLLFKGSAKYPGLSFSKTIENSGGYLNAATSNEFTQYYANIPKESAETALTAFADIILNPLFPIEEIEKERKVVIEEMQRFLDNPRAKLSSLFYENIYKTSALKNSVIGRREIIENIERGEICAFYKQNYCPEKMLIAVCGSFDEEKILKIIEGTFAKAENLNTAAQPKLKETVFEGVNLTLNADIENAYLISGFLGIGADGDDREILAADLSAMLLGGLKSSPLRRILEEEKQLAFEIDCDYDLFRESGVLYITAEAASENIEPIKDEIRKQIEKIASGKIEPQALERAKIALKTDFLFSIETPSGIADNLGLWHLLGKSYIADNYPLLIDLLTEKDVADFFAKYYRSDRFSNAVMIPSK
ncbi:MAG: insulinase family protein [Elusimicrobiota bacterium]|jgi:predicted Zn-dependent peptidase|nr:insulinase family protein [Elusimicrobiota bacterium]